MTIKLSLGDLSAKARKWEMHHEIYNQNDAKCAHITVQGSWIDLEKRKLTVPPEEIFQALTSLERGEKYVYTKEK